MVAVESHRAMIVRDRNNKNFPVKLFFALHSSVDIDDTSYGASHNASILSICYNESHGAAVYLACEKRKVHLVDCDEKEDIIDIIDGRTELVKLLVC